MNVILIRRIIQFFFQVTDALRVCIQLALDNTPAIKVKTVEVHGRNDPLAATFVSVLQNLPLIQCEYIIISKQKVEVPKGITVENKSIGTETDAMFVIDFDLTTRPDVSSSFVPNQCIHQILVKHKKLISPP